MRSFGTKTARLYSTTTLRDLIHHRSSPSDILKLIRAIPFKVLVLRREAFLLYVYPMTFQVTSDGLFPFTGGGRKWKFLEQCFALRYIIQLHQQYLKTIDEKKELYRTTPFFMREILLIS